jgi:transposase
LAKPYSYDLRQKVIQAIEQDGMNKSEEAPNLQYQPQHDQPVAQAAS